MKGGKDEVEQLLQQEIDKQKAEGSVAWEDPEYIDSMRGGVCKHC